MAEGSQKTRKVLGWVLFILGIAYMIVAPAAVKGYTDATGNLVFGGMSLQIGIAIGLVSGGWLLAHPKRRQK